MTGEAAPVQRARHLYNLRDFLALEDELRSANPATARALLEWCLTLPNPARITAMELVLGAWMRDEPEAAFSWAMKQDRDFFASPEFVRGCTDLHDLQLGLRGVAVVGNAARRVQLEALGHEFAAIDFSGVCEVASRLTFAQSVALKGGALRALAASDPDTVLSSVLNSADQGKELLLQDVAAGMVDGLGSIEAARRLDVLSPDPNLARSYITAAAAVGSQDPKLVLSLAQKAISVTPDKGIADSALATLLVKVRDAPPLRAEIAALTSNPTLMASRLSEPLAQWAVRDPAAAAAFVEGLRTAPEIKTKLLGVIRQ